MIVKSKLQKLPSWLCHARQPPSEASLASATTNSSTLLSPPFLEEFVTHTTQISIALASPAEVPSKRTPTAEPPAERVVRRKALLIGVCQVRKTASAKSKIAVTSKSKSKKKAKKEDFGILQGPHDDVRATRTVLIEKYGYRSDDIVVLIDADDQSEDLRPTRANIIRHMMQLVHGAKAGDRFYFHFSGHSGQVPTKDDPGEEDGMNECIFSCDGYRIIDNKLRKLIVNPLPRGCHLTAVFDCCHSGSLLDLHHWRCNQVYLPWINKGFRRTNTLWRMTVRRLACAFTLDGLVHIRTGRGSLHSKFKPRLEAVPSDVALRRTTSPVDIFCAGDKCRDAWNLNQHAREGPDVVCLSSAADGQKSWEDENGASMTLALIDILSQDPNPTLTKVLARVSYALHKQYTVLHARARGYRKEVQAANALRRIAGKLSLEGDSVEMNNFQNPQLSSLQPLDMQRLWDP